MDQISDFDIAIVGMSCRLPKAPGIAEYWQNLRNGVECVTRFSREQLLAAGVSLATLDDPFYVPASAILEDVARFDNQLFGYLPREAMLMDPQQRIFLECCWAALEDSGHAPRSSCNRPVGVFAGATMNRYLFAMLRSDPDLIERFGEQTVMLTNDKDLLPMRAAFKLGLAGPCVNIQATCATSLVAVHYACRSLFSGDCDLALAGGASVRVPHPVGYVYSERGTSSPDGRCRPFDAAANGSVPGSGAGVVVLKRLADAIADRDTIRAVIRGTGLSNDGCEKGTFTAPSVQGQRRAVLDAFSVAGISADTIDYVECHGTATSLGDPIEVQALTEAFRQMTNRVGFCRLGSVKANIGHLDAAAGVAGLIKVVLALEKGFVPPTLNFTQANPELRLLDTPFLIADRLLEWNMREDRPRRAGVNSIGMGGVNAHVIVEEAPTARPRSAIGRWFLMPMSAQTPSALQVAVSRLEQHLAQDAASMPDVAFTLQKGRAELAHRRVLVCGKGGEHRIVAGGALGSAPPAALFIFPGQGTQYPGMGSALYRTHPEFRRAFDACADASLAAGGPDLLRLVVARADGDTFWLDTSVGQAALFAVEWSMARAIEEAGVKADAVIGYSLGELVGATLAGVFSLPDAIALVVERGRLMMAAPMGGMLAIAASAESVARSLPDGIAIAGVLGPQRCIAAGPTSEIQEFQETLVRDGIGFQRLRVDRAFHSPCMQQASDAFEQAVARYTLKPPTRPIYSTLTGSELSAEDAVSPSYWARQIREPVRFADALHAVPRGRGLLAVICGPGGGIVPAVNSIDSLSGVLLAASDRFDQTSFDEERQLLEAIAGAWVRGLPVNWDALRLEPAGRVPLPTYSFEGEAAWFSPQARAMSESPSRPAHDLATAAMAVSSIQLGSGGINAEISVLADRIVIRTSPGASLSPAQPSAQAVPGVHMSASTVAVASPEVRAVSEERSIEATITSIVQELFGIRGVDMSASFTALGADSLLLTQLLARIRRALAPELSMAKLIECGSVRGLVEIVSGTRPAAELPHQPPQPAAPANTPNEVDIEVLLRQLESLPREEIERELARVENGQ